MKRAFAVPAAALALAACATPERPPPEAALELCERHGLCPYPFTGYGMLPATTRTPVVATALIGAEIVDPEGRSVGRIDDLALDLRDERVSYAILKLVRPGAGEERRAVPLEALERSLGRRQLVLPAGEQRGAAAGAGTEARMARASSVIGRTLLAPDGRRLGRITDVIVDLESARAPHALVHGNAQEDLGAVSLRRLVLHPALPQARLVSSPSAAFSGQ